MADLTAPRDRYLVIVRNPDGTLEGAVSTDAVTEAIRVVAEDDYGLGRDGYEAIYDSVGYDRRGPTLLCGRALVAVAVQFLVERAADERHERSLERTGG